jgi:FtsP/CotA-like multicopper oxidase with cupredoxin domain
VNGEGLHTLRHRVRLPLSRGLLTHGLWHAAGPSHSTDLGQGQRIYVVARFGPHRGDFMFHCHNLIHGGCWG